MITKKNEPAGDWEHPQTFREAIMAIESETEMAEVLEIVSVVEKFLIPWRPIQWGYQFLTEHRTKMTWYPNTGRCVWYEPGKVFAHSSARPPAYLLLDLCLQKLDHEFRRRPNNKEYP